ncbi:MAG: CRISPR system precrRNA processing endoribonuclease RAMP protein Cas6 [Nocardiopsaceae bacterium]|nr:CRISPR system precrRNA processing endoribonuclease RAMP protein Cas6 [Nocardiopsaceae bacterium]
MPVIIELRLRAPGRDYVPKPAQLHGLACSLFEGVSYDGHAGQEKPFSVWPLVSVEDGWLLRAAWLGAGIPRAALAACGELRVGPVFCTVSDVALRPVSFGDLASSPACEGARLEFRSPAYFSSNGERLVAPDPRLIVGSWRRRWNASVGAVGDLAMGDEGWLCLYRALRLAEFDLRTVKQDSGYGRSQPGFTGKATLRFARGTSAEARSRFGTLARFAEFCGTGAQTTHGFGATTVTLLPLSRPPTPVGPRESAGQRLTPPEEGISGPGS